MTNELEAGIRRICPCLLYTSFIIVGVITMFQVRLTSKREVEV